MNHVNYLYFVEPEDTFLTDHGLPNQINHVWTLEDTIIFIFFLSVFDILRTMRFDRSRSSTVPSAIGIAFVFRYGERMRRLRSLRFSSCSHCIDARQ